MSLLNCLCAAIPARERVISVEEVFELRIPLPDVVSMQTRQPNLEGNGAIPLRRLVKEALRMRPSRIIVGEVRQEEALDLLIALNSGFPEIPNGNYATAPLTFSSADPDRRRNWRLLYGVVRKPSAIAMAAPAQS